MTARTFLNIPEFPAGSVLFIDALDERRAGRGDQDTIDRIIQKLFMIKPVKVRISCRAQDWLGSADLEAFRVYFQGRGGVAVVSLEALSNDEKRVVLISNGAAEEEARLLLREAEQRGLLEFTLNPQNLIMLAQAVKDGQWPSTRRELFELSSGLYLRDAAGPMTTREIVEGVMAAKKLPEDDARARELIQKTVLGSLNRATDTIERVEAAGSMAWRVI